MVHHVALAPAVGETLQPDVVLGDVSRGVQLEQGQVIEHPGGVILGVDHHAAHSSLLEVNVKPIRHRTVDLILAKHI